MKKQILFVLVIMCALVLVSCKADIENAVKDYTDLSFNADKLQERETPDKKDEFIKKAEEIAEYSRNYLETAVTQYEMNTESGVVREKWENLLAEISESLSKNLSESQLVKLEENALEWLSKKESAINKAASEWKGGSGEPMARNMAAIQAMEERFSYLISLFN